ncbi:MAG: hypothetical protein ACYTEW_25580 [Planctomycetota bacterium]
MCQPRETPRYIGMLGCGLLCSFFFSKEEQERLKTYRNQLKKELASVEERIKETQGKFLEIKRS